MSNTHPVKLSPKAREVVQQAIKNIKAHPEHFDMDNWIDGRVGQCGTTACLAGHITLAANLRPFTIGGIYAYYEDLVSAKAAKRKLNIPLEPKERTENRVRMADVAARLLGEPDGDCLDRLFLSSHWPRPFRSQYAKLVAIDPTKQVQRKLANLAVKRLRHFLKTGE